MYFDLIYVPHHGNPHYVDAEFFKNLRAPRYVFSGLNPATEVLSALLNGKKAWNQPLVEVKVLPTYESQTMAMWASLQADSMEQQNIALLPAAERYWLII